MTISRKAVFTAEIRAACNKISGGSPQYRTCIEFTAKHFVNDLKTIGLLPVHFKNIRAETIIKLVDYWRRKGLKHKTLKNKLGILRSLLQAAEVSVIIPSNHELGIKSTYKIKEAPTTQITPYEFEATFLKDLFLLQYLFGLKKHEALRFNNSMIKDACIEIPRITSYNNKERYIPVFSSEQREFLDQFNPEAITSSIRGLSLIHASALSTKKIKHPDYFRHLYIWRRFQSLSNLFEHAAFKQIAKETGYTQIVQVREIIKCLKET